MSTNKIFSNQKQAAFAGQDLSRKGSVDEPIKELVDFINSLESYFTTSSCSGRIVVLADTPEEEPSIQKDGCKWVHVSHIKCTCEEIFTKLDPSIGDLSFKFEAFVLHVQCRTLDDAQLMLSCGVQAGFRNSGISLKSRKNSNQEWPKIIVAIRSTHGIEAPLSTGGKLLVTSEYVDHIVTKANMLMDENLKRITRFHQKLVQQIKVE
ncbi:tRNA wybutosine-synthesizing protein 3 homolog [Daphnia pulex]|uniref:tRNA wybutosine-synthesizing protein 3 homolog n=1 Tax=Daphnia pulex TaxID=6669 RepID=UPI001EE057B2|nr:tRNA wybutosine-synthesizing protein 3 homolog [Daphnia pulex]XP_046441259.1 tRNA wybutosine-synthesizing protein 3 homolog [Daphnia pulex]XP_046441260.1 tRNA wybutosine-synthesizing protein 3 homolog [Daphnia pulex]XP_046646534.1 tRNA wybutosine-synthesizing protein 3 homolog isoform X2 [Daphnia pulicaria]XP_046646535.1 tRNA wybutosine-synthesizing protein 3 homolog isoform X2 [Daphnia pulicaria]